MFQPDRKFLPVSRSVSDYLVISLILLSFRSSILQEDLFPHQGRAKQSEEVASSEVQSQLIKSRAPTKLENTEKDQFSRFWPLPTHHRSGSRGAFVLCQTAGKTPPSPFDGPVGPPHPQYQPLCPKLYLTHPSVSTRPPLGTVGRLHRGS